MHVVFGVTGRVGGEVARALIKAGEAVRVVVRRKEQGDPWIWLGAEVAVASLDDGASVAAALEGAVAAFVLNPTPMDGEPAARAAAVGAALTEAVDRARPGKVIVLSSLGAQHASGVGIISTLHHIEAALAQVAVPVAFIRPGYFVDTWSEVIEPVLNAGVLPTFIPPDHRMAMVSTVDVGTTAAALMMDEWTGRRIVELLGPQDWTPREVAAAFAKCIGWAVEPVFIPPAGRAAAMADAGVPARLAAGLIGMYEAIADGTATGEATSEQRRGTVGLDAAVARLVRSAGGQHPRADDAPRYSHSIVPGGFDVTS